MKTTSAKVARRYAKALVSLCDERGDGEAVRSALVQLDAVLSQVPEALELLADPTRPLDQRKQLLAEVTARTQVQGTALDFVRLLLDKGRIGELPRIAQEFGEMLDARSGRVQAEVASATALAPAAQDRLASLLQRLLGKQVVLTTRVDPELIGGLVVRVGNTVYDASIANHLTRLRHQLVTG